MPQSHVRATSLQAEGSTAAFALQTQPQAAAVPTTSATQAHQQTAAAPLAGLQQHMQQHVAINSQLQLVLRTLHAGRSDRACSSVLALAAVGLRHPTPCPTKY